LIQDAGEGVWGVGRVEGARLGAKGEGRRAKGKNRIGQEGEIVF